MPRLTAGTVTSPRRRRWPKGFISAKVAWSGSARRPHSATVMPSRDASMASALPIPEPAPVISARLPSSRMTYDGMTHLELAINVAVEPVEDLGCVDHDLLGSRAGEAVYKRLEKGDMFDVERAVRAKVGESLLAARPERALNGVGGLVGEKRGHTLEHVHAAEHGIGAYPLDGVIGIADHDLAGDPGHTVPDRIGVAAHRGNVIQDPFLVAALLLHVLEKGILIGLVLGARGGESKQREGVLNVVIGLSEKIEIELARGA